MWNCGIVELWRVACGNVPVRQEAVKHYLPDVTFIFKQINHLTNHLFSKIRMSFRFL